MLVTKKATAKLCGPAAKPCRSNVKPCGPNAKPCGPNASQWNIGRVGSPDIGARVGHVHFMLFVSISFGFGSKREREFPVEYWLKPTTDKCCLMGQTLHN